MPTAKVNNTYLVFDPENETSFDRVAYTYYDGAMLRFDSEVGRDRTVKEIRLLREGLVESVDDVDDSVWSVGPTVYSLLGLGDAPERFGGETIASERYTQLQLVPNEPALE